ncbi:MAG: FAD-binding protein, partial [Chloroflexota bacterium]|nr:FAD-binding protein [Chloroflexota bacterium]
MERKTLIRKLTAIVGPQGVISEPEQLLTYESDGLRNYRAVPMVVVLPTSTEQVRAVVRLCYEEGIPIVPRGSGTGLSAGALPVEGGIVLGLSRMREILEVDLANARAVVQPGVLNLWVTQRVAPHGYYYAPDPSSQQVCSIGGNVAENSGGAHCLKYGFTVNHVLGLTVVLSDGEVVRLGGKAVDKPGYDLVGVFVGSEGTLGIVT